MNRKHEQLLVELAHEAMIDKGLKPQFERDVLQQLDSIQGPARNTGVSDLR